MDENRRSFLKKAGSAALGLGCGFPLLSGCCGHGEHAHEADPNQRAMVVDIEKLKNPAVRQKCIDACHSAHKVPEVERPNPRAKQWIWSEEFAKALPGQMHASQTEHFEGLDVLVLCNHCTSPACVKVCPTAATWKRPSDGIVMMDMHRCIGCRYCIMGCPYGARSFNWQDPNAEGETVAGEYPERSRGVVEKCTFCTERIRKDQDPLCVEALKGDPEAEGALTFGKLSDEPVAAKLRDNHTVRRLPGLGTEPNVYYILPKPQPEDPQPKDPQPKDPQPKDQA